jgi:hypothetical protein
MIGISNTFISNNDWNIKHIHINQNTMLKTIQTVFFDMNLFYIFFIFWYECVLYSYHCLIWMCLIFLSLFDMNVFDIPIIVWYECVWYSYHCLIWMCLIFLSLFDKKLKTIQTKYNSNSNQCYCPVKNNSDRIQYQQQSMLLSC